MVKKQSKLVRLVCLLIASLMCLVLFSGCKDGGKDKNEGTSSKETSSIKDTDAMESYAETWNPNIPERQDLGGFELKFAARNMNMIIPKEGVSEDDDQIVEIMKDLQNRYNCKFSVREVKDWGTGDVMSELLTGSEVAHVLMPEVWRSGLYVSARILMDWNSESIKKYVHTDELWWNSTMAYASNVNGKVYAGACNIQNYADWTYVCLFNKKILSEIGSSADELYKMYDDKTWNWEAFRTLAKKAVKDLNDDGQMTDADQYGFCSSDYDALVALISSADADCIRSNNGKDAHYTYAKPREIQVLTTLNEMYTLDGSYFAGSMERVDGVRGDVRQFTSGKSLFFLFTLSSIKGPDYRTMSEDLGILPVPLGPSNDGKGWQSEYMSRVDHNFFATLIPANNSDPEKTALLLEAIAFVRWRNTNDRMDAYGVLYCSDDKSAEIVKEVYNFSSFEISQFVYSVNNQAFARNVCWAMGNITKIPGMDIAGQWGSVEQVAQDIIDAYFSDEPLTV